MLRRMDSSQLTTDQAKLMAERVQPMLGYLHALRSRCEKRFPPSDVFRQMVEKAYDSVHSLSVRLHYMTCEKGVGGPPRR